MMKTILASSINARFPNAQLDVLDGSRLVAVHHLNLKSDAICALEISASPKCHPEQKIMGALSVDKNYWSETSPIEFLTVEFELVGEPWFDHFNRQKVSANLSYSTLIQTLTKELEDESFRRDIILNRPDLMVLDAKITSTFLVESVLDYQRVVHSLLKGEVKNTNTMFDVLYDRRKLPVSFGLVASCMANHQKDNPIGLRQTLKQFVDYRNVLNFAYCAVDEAHPSMK